MGILQAFIDLPFRIGITDILNIVLIDTNFVFINIWWLVHLATFSLITFLLLRTKLSRMVIFLIVISKAVVYEIIEWFAYTSWIPVLFIIETKVDVVWDIIASVVAVGLVFWLSKKKKKKEKIS